MLYEQEKSEQFFVKRDSDEEIIFSFYGLEYEVRWFSKTSGKRLKVIIKFNAADQSIIDMLDLYQARARRLFARKVAKLTGESERLIESNLFEIIAELEKYRRP